MANVEKTQVDSTSTIFKISITKSDYLPTYEKELKTYRNKAQLKGFRQGSAPLSVVKKLYGKSIMYETVMEMVNTELYKAMRENQLNVLASPELVEDQTEKLELNVDQPVESYTMAFKVGHYTLDIKGLDDSTVLTRFVLNDMTKRAEEELDRLARRAIRPEETSEKIAEGDIFYIESKELNTDGSEKEDGYETTITVYSKSMKMQPAAADLFYGKLASGNTCTFNPRDLESWEAGADAEGNYRRYILGLESTDDRQINDLFHGTIKTVLRVGDPVYDANFFETSFKPGITTKEAAIEDLKERLGEEYNEVFKSTLRREAKIELVKHNMMPLPEQMLEKWFRQNDPRLTDENIKENMPALCNQVRLQILTDYVAEELGVEEVTEAEIEQHFAEAFREQYGFYIPDQYLKPMTKKMMARKEEVSEARFTLRHRKVMDYCVGQMKIKEVTVSEEELKAAMDAQVAADNALFRVNYA